MTAPAERAHDSALVKACVHLSDITGRAGVARYGNDAEQWVDDIRATLIRLMTAEAADIWEVTHRVGHVYRYLVEPGRGERWFTGARLVATPPAGDST